ncbi:MAG: AIPR family protein [Rhodovibrio sp.]|nr:AIPR family protein [Rhodovibrio sp.]
MTLIKPSKRGNVDSFCIRNNGITIVARSLNKVGNRFTIEDYQIVNGCQTSHVIFNNRSTISGNFFVPIKLIVTEDQTIQTQLSALRTGQTEVRLEELASVIIVPEKIRGLL